MDKGEADAAALVVGVPAERAEAQGGGSADMATGADHVAYYLVLVAECYERQFRQPPSLPVLSASLGGSQGLTGTFDAGDSVDRNG